MLDLESARLFIDVLDSGSLSGAAEKNYLSKSTVKKRMDDLEAFAGTPLLERGARGTIPTAAGSAFLLRIRSLLRIVNEIPKACTSAATESLGRVLRMAYYTDFLAPMIQYCCDRYTKKHPLDTIQPVFTRFSNVYSGARDGLFDIAICTKPSPELSAGLSCTVLYATRLGAFVLASNPLAQKGILARADLAAHEVVMHSMWCPAQEVIAWSRAREPFFDVHLTPRGTEAMQEVCSRGGICLYPETDASQFPYAFVPLEDHISSYSTIVYSSNPSQAALDFVQSTLEYLAPYTDPRDLRLHVDWSTRPQ